jgi:hypothetical protein
MVEFTAVIAIQHAENPQITASTHTTPQQEAPSSLYRAGPESTKTRSETHIRRSRVRRKRKRLPSNRSIETDAAISLRVFPEDYCAASLPIEC